MKGLPDIRDIQGPFTPDQALPWLSPALAVSSFLVALAAACLLFRLRKNKSSPRLRERGDDFAVLFEEVKQRYTEGEEDARWLFQELSYLVRRCLGQRTGLAMLKLTTEEILGQVKEEPLGDGEKAVLVRFFERCDMVKFAGYEPSSSEAETVLTDASKIIRGDKE